MKKKYTIKTELHMFNNQPIINYFEHVVARYSYIFRSIFHIINNSKGKLKNQSKINTCLQKKYFISTRTANSIIKMAQGRYNSIKELKQYELTQIKARRKKIMKKVHAQLPKLKMLKIKASYNQLNNDELKSYRNLKTQVSWRKIKINRLTNKINTLKKQIENGKFKVCFGTKDLHNENKHQFILQRDKMMVFIGNKSETCCNLNLQLKYNKKNNQFSIKLRKDFKTDKDNKYVYGQCYFNHHKNKLIQNLNTRSSPLTYIIMRENGRYYLLCTFTIEYSIDELFTRYQHGTIGIDFNKGFLAITETNQYGHMINTWRKYFRFNKGNQTQTDLEQIIAQLTDLALKKGKDIIIEDLNFVKRKSQIIKATSNYGKKYNRMLSSLSYRKFIKLCENICFRKRVYLKKVNPAWTSWIGKYKFQPNMKLNIHQSASFVIARRGMNIKDNVA